MLTIVFPRNVDMVTRRILDISQYGSPLESILGESGAALLFVVSVFILFGWSPSLTNSPVDVRFLDLKAIMKIKKALKMKKKKKQVKMVLTATIVGYYRLVQLSAAWKAEVNDLSITATLDAFRVVSREDKIADT